MNPLAVLFGAFCILAFAVGSLAVFSLRLDPKATLNRAIAVALAFEVVKLLATGVDLQADAGLFWVSWKVAQTATFFGAVVSNFALAVFSGVPPRWRWKILAPAGLFSLAATALVWTDHGFLSGFHPSAWGNVGQSTADPGVLQFGALMNLCSSVTSLGLLVWAWLQKRSRSYKTILAFVTALSVLLTGWMYFAFAVVWLGWGLPDLTELGVSLAIFLFYSFLIANFRHLSEDRPDFEQLLVSHLRGIVLFVNREGRILQSSQRADELLGPTEAGVLLTRRLSAWPELEAHWNRLTVDHRVSQELSGTVAGVRYRLSLIPHRNGFHEFDGAIVRLVPEGFFDEVIQEYKISPREHDVARLLLEGMDHLQIAEAMFISPGTVRNHLHRLYSKTGTKSRSDLTRRLLSGHPGKVD